MTAATFILICILIALLTVFSGSIAAVVALWLCRLSAPDAMERGE